MSALCRVSDAETARPSTRAGAAVRKAPRHEIAGGGALMVPRVLWGFSRGVGLEQCWPKWLSQSRCQKGMVVRIGVSGRTGRCATRLGVRLRGKKTQRLLTSRLHATQALRSPVAFKRVANVKFSLRAP